MTITKNLEIKDMNHPFHRADIDQQDQTENNKKIRSDLFRLLENNGIVFDVGASRGQFALQILEDHPTAKIFAFEPHPDAYGDLFSLSEKFSQLIPVSTAISRDCGEVVFNLTEGDVGSSLRKPIEGQSSQWLSHQSTITVVSTRLDKFIQERGLAEDVISLLKVDAQGADLEVVKSAGEFLRPESIKAILIEINFVPFYESQDDYFKIFEFLDWAGYRLAWIYPLRDYQEWTWCADVLFIQK